MEDDPNNYPSITTVEKWSYDGRTRKINWFRLSPEHAHWTGYATTSLTENYRLLETEIRVNGGLTYGVDDDGFVGFDCAHAWDACERDGRLYGVFRDRENVTVWTQEKVREEVESLVDQLEQIEERESEEPLPSFDLREIDNGGSDKEDT